MKKTLTYTVMAILLGTVIMLFPVFILFPSETSTMRGSAPSPPAPETYAKDMENGAEVEAATVEVITPFPSSLINASFISVLGFLAALVVSKYFKRRIL